jgi:uncharacterized protein YecE (DUF72 family)
VPAQGRARVGISGWRYPPWRGVFYPQDLPQKRELAFASRAVDTIEINGSFYSLQRPEYFAQWHTETPDGFQFSIKGSRYITHILRARSVEVALANFFASGIASLRDKLGPFLWQFPPNAAYDASALDAFLALLPRDTDAASALARRHDARLDGRAQVDYARARPQRHALEVRHRSVVDPTFVRLLRRHRVALVVADTGGRWPEYDDVTADFVYVRLHGAKELYASGYSDRILREWAARVDRWRRGGEPDAPRRILDAPAPGRARRDVFVYFDNTAKEYAPRNAQRLAAMLKRAAG